MAQILVVDDEVGIRELLSEILTDEGHDVRVAENAAAARQARDEARPDLVLLDIWMPDIDGITLLKEWAAGGQLTMPVIMMSGHGTIDTAVEATKVGALDFLEKPIGMQKLLAAVSHGLERGLKRAPVGLSLAAFTRSAPLKDLKRRIEQVAAKSRALMLRSSPGGIVELAARTLQVPGKAWVDLAGSSEPLSLESLESAGGGVLYCEELARLTRLQQKNLLFALERLEKFNLRLIAGTAHDAAALAAHGWDEAALRRLAEVWLAMPSLAELKDEIPEIASHLLTGLAEAGETPLRRFSTGALNSLRQHAWPGGYGELKSAIRSLALAALEEEIDSDEIRRVLFPGAPDAPAIVLPCLSSEALELPLREARELFERAYFEHHLRADGGNMTRLAERSGLERTHLYRKLKDLGLRGGKGDE
ncbi:MAG: sigma-54-dependent Fis family transcriptional regulator [Rhodocyclales bacterium]|nr:sigma-54-dependent Fis family transcriptional regulator [Rhodocyclales bacterium]